MERYGRRNRRGRCRGFQTPQAQHQQPRSNGLLSFLQTLVVMGSIMALVYMMMEYHCKACNSKCQVNKLAKQIGEISVNLFRVHGYYVELENKVSKFSQELPKIEGQIEVLESLARNLVAQRHERNPRSHFTLPMSDAYPPLQKCQSLPHNNLTKISLPCRKASQVQ